MQIINYRLRLNTISALLFAHFNTHDARTEIGELLVV